MNPYYTCQQLAQASGLSLRSIRHHVKSGWLKPEPKAPGVRGLRFSHFRASKWLGLHFPGKSLQPTQP